MTARIEIQMDNAAFDDGTQGQAELSRILSVLAERLQPPGYCYVPSDSITLRDINGNRVGKFEVLP